MKLLFSFVFSLLFSLTLHAQFHYIVTSEPDSAEVLVNGETRCYTPCKIKYRWREAVDKKLVFTVKQDGYKVWSDTLKEKPHYFDRRDKVYLKKDFPIYDLDSGSSLINFDRLFVEFKDGTVVGKKVDLKGNIEELKWRGSIKLGDEIYEEKFYRFLTDMGYRSPLSENAKLFSNDTRRRPKLPRYTVGVEITDYNLSYIQSKEKDYYSGNVKGKINVEYKWQVLDKSNGKIALTYTNRGIYKFRQDYYQRVENNLDAYELALIDFLSSEEFNGLITNTNNSVSLSESNDSTALSSAKSNEIEKVEIEKFTKQSDMIQHANRSCVTIITDGGHGSGVVISKSGLVLSAYHVVEGVNQIDVKFSSGLILKATVVDYDSFNDIALLDITGEGFPALPLLPVDGDVALGEEVLTIGTPAELELGQSISKGILSGKRKIDDRVYLQADIAVSPGNSGGPLLNTKGEVIGIVQRKIIGDGIEGIGFAVPMAKIREQLGLVELSN